MIVSALTDDSPSQEAAHHLSTVPEQHDGQERAAEAHAVD